LKFLCADPALQAARARKPAPVHVPGL